eukprot:TRINITY_DN22933_c0_g1_i1.p1 TRINITY_DN22933_c0_g1~~TRINITY_DN22933_c0_g1_i1.p1  ORF type:complete len:246 (-),score=51.99 TRINITY_DN22933_c0_g1_i1:157-894(-)
MSVLVSVLVAASALCVGGVATVVGLFVFVVGDRSRRERISEYPLGLRIRAKNPLKHSILDVSAFDSYADYVASVKKQSAVKNLKSLSASFAEHRIKATTKNHSEACVMRWEHYLVIRAHEARVYGPVRSAFVGVLRWLSAALMVGTMDEYRIDGRLVAFTIQIIKGSTLRSMWFYQRPEVSRCRLWFHTKQTTVTRAIAMHIRHVDLGPSLTKEVEELKSLYGFESTAVWRQICDYDGPFLDPKF